MSSGDQVSTLSSSTLWNDQDLSDKDQAGVGNVICGSNSLPPPAISQRNGEQIVAWLNCVPVARAGGRRAAAARNGQLLPGINDERRMNVVRLRDRIRINVEHSPKNKKKKNTGQQQIK